MNAVAAVLCFFGFFLEPGVSSSPPTSAPSIDGRGVLGFLLVG